MTTQDPIGSDQGASELPSDPAGELRELEEIDEEECFALLESQDLGRLAIVRDGRPEIFPVNYALIGSDHRNPKSPRSKTGPCLSDWVAFEVEDIDRDTREGWVVEVRGFAQDISDGADPWSEQARNSGPRPWVTGSHEHFIAISHSLISGRRLRRGEPRLTGSRDSRVGDAARKAPWDRGNPEYQVRD